LKYRFENFGGIIASEARGERPTASSWLRRVASTIDNDLYGTDVSIGSDTAEMRG